MDRKFLGFDKEDKEMTSWQVSKLRKQSAKFISEKYFPEISDKFIAEGFNVKIQLDEIKEKDYAAMQQSMLYNPSLPFDKLMARIRELKGRVNAIKF